MRHNHRITPGHMGGEYVEGNVISVEVTNCDKQTANHVMWHYANWVLWGKHEDKIAWKGLAGFWGQEEIIKESFCAGGLYAGNLPHWTNGDKEIRALESPGEEWRRGRSKAMRDKLSETCTGKKDTLETRTKKSKSSKGKKKKDEHREKLANHLNKPEICGARAKALKKANAQKWLCTVTGKVSTAGPLTLYQRSKGISTDNRVKLVIEDLPSSDA